MDIRSHLEGEEVFLANYGDVLTDAPLNDMIQDFLTQGKVGMLSTDWRSKTPSTSSYERGSSGRSDGRRRDLGSMDEWGHFIFRREIFDYIGPEDLVLEPFNRLIEEGQFAYKHEGFWAPLDTLEGSRGVGVAIQLVDLRG